jgi:Putative MetA-pathway of phenol degradation
MATLTNRWLPCRDNVLHQEDSQVEQRKLIGKLNPSMHRFFLLLLFASVSTVSAQSPSDPDFIVPARPTVSNPAEFQKPGVLQLEFGYNSNFHAPGVSSAQDFPLALRFAFSKRLLLEFDGDNPISQTSAGVRMTGPGDTQLGIQVVLQHEKDTRPAISAAYYIKLPTASSGEGLGTGRVDHNFIALVSKNVREMTIDFNAIYLLAGRTSDNGHASSGQAALAVSRKVSNRWGIQGEISGFSRNDEQTGAVFLLGAVTYQVNRRLALDSGARAGLTHDAPRVGFFAGMTVGVANLYHRGHHGLTPRWMRMRN